MTQNNILKEKPVILSIDDGFGDSKFYNGHKPYYIPSFVTEYIESRESDIIIDEKKTFDNIVVEINGEKYYVGKSALEHNSEISWEGGENKHLSPYFPILLKTILGLMTKTDQTEVDMLVWGLPVRAEQDEKRQELLREIILKPHDVKVSVNDKEFEHKTINIKNLQIIAQPKGTLFDLVLDNNGEFKNKELASQYNIVADIGARTFNIYTSNKLKAIHDKCDNNMDGMYFAYQKVNNIIAQLRGNPVNDGHLKEIIDEGKIAGKSLEKPIQQSYSMLASKIRNTIDKMFVNNFPMVDNIIFTGGGATLLKPYLEHFFNERNINVIFCDRYNTVRGLYKYGQVQYKRNFVKQSEVTN